MQILQNENAIKIELKLIYLCLEQNFPNCVLWNTDVPLTSTKYSAKNYETEVRKQRNIVCFYAFNEL